MRDKQERICEYRNYLEYRKDYKIKLSFEEFKKNHKHRFKLWKKQRYAEYVAKFAAGIDPITSPKPSRMMIMDMFTGELKEFKTE